MELYSFQDGEGKCGTLIALCKPDTPTTQLINLRLGIQMSYQMNYREVLRNSLVSLLTFVSVQNKVNISDVGVLIGD